MNDDHDELTGIFDHIRPEDFAAGPNQGEEAFSKFFDANIQTVRTAFMASDGQLNPFACLADSTSQIILVPTDDETLNQYVARVRSEARRLGARWVFLCRTTLVANFDVKRGDTIPDATDPVALQEAIEKGLMVEGMFVYAERVEGSERSSRVGMMKTMNNATLGPLVEGDTEEQSVDFFKGLLG